MCNPQAHTHYSQLFSRAAWILTVHMHAHTHTHTHTHPFRCHVCCIAPLHVGCHRGQGILVALLSSSLQLFLHKTQVRHKHLTNHRHIHANITHRQLSHTEGSVSLTEGGVRVKMAVWLRETRAVCDSSCVPSYQTQQA